MRFIKINSSLQIIAIIAVTLLFGNYIPEIIKSVCYSISVIFKNFLSCVLPFIILGCLFSSIIILKNKNEFRFILLLFPLIFLSNYMSTMVAYIVGSISLVDANKCIIEPNSMRELAPLWNVEFPIILTNNCALCCGIIFGWLFSFCPDAFKYKCSLNIKKSISFFLDKCFSPILPIFSGGFILKMHHEGILAQVIKSYSSLMFLIALTCILYIAFLFAIASNFNFLRWRTYIKNVLPAVLTGFSTMSSLAAMPLTLAAAEKNTRDLDVARITIPATVNIHMIGLAINIPLMAISILLSFNYSFPSFNEYNKFAIHFVLTQFATAATPAGGVLLMIPLLENYLNFNTEMSALIVSLYILFDTVETGANILGNSVLVIIFSKIRQYWFRRKNRTKNLLGAS